MGQVSTWPCGAKRKGPSGYLAALEWLEWMSKRFKQVKCRKCGRYHIWRRKS